MVTNTIPSPMLKFSKQSWDFRYNQKLSRWETYRNPRDWPGGLHDWLVENFGPTFFAVKKFGQCRALERGEWDTHGGWIYLYKEEQVVLFNLRWS